MAELLDTHHNLLCWLAQFSLLPLHWMTAVGHQYSTAMTIGSAVMVLYATTPVRHARKYGFGNHD